MADYIKLVKSLEELTAFKASNDFVTPNVTVVYGDTTIDYNPIHDYSQDYLTFVAKEDGTFKFSGNSINYSVNDGETWTTLESGIDSPTVQVGNKIMFKATLAPTTSSGIGTFSSTSKFAVQGNVMSLLYGDNFIGKKDLTGNNYTFRYLFKGCTGLTNTKNLCLPATTLANNCYDSMFQGCKSLTNAPELPATALTYKCYQAMFYGCTALTVAPKLPATTLTNCCYQAMFSGCTALTIAPTLPAITLADYCYDGMFRNCTTLTTTPELPATTLAPYCYENMFYGCTALTTAPELPATTLTIWCYSNMFYGCTALTVAPELPATTLTDYCYSYMFSGCSTLTIAPTLPAATLANYCYKEMFLSCTNLNYIKMLATDISATDCLNVWVATVSSTGTFVKHPNMTSLPTGINGIPTGWTVQDAA